jgi:hypothetical protein
MQCSSWIVGPVDQGDGLEGLGVNNEIIAIFLCPERVLCANCSQ